MVPPRTEALNPLVLSSKDLLQASTSSSSSSSSSSTSLNTLALMARIEEQLNGHDPLQTYTTIQRDLEDKYLLAAAFYKELNDLRDMLVCAHRLDPADEARRKRTLAARLDAVVDTLRRDFATYIGEYYRLRDALFVVHTNRSPCGALLALQEEVDAYLRTAETVYTEEFHKMERIYLLLDDEGHRLNGHVEKA